MIVLFAIFGHSFKLPRTIPVFNLFANIMRAFTIGVRYGTTNENRYRLVKDVVFSGDENRQEFLIPGWMNPSSEVLDVHI